MNESQFIEKVKKLFDTFISNWIYIIDEYEKEVEKDSNNLEEENLDEGVKEWLRSNGYEEYTYKNYPSKSEITD